MPVTIMTAANEVSLMKRDDLEQMIDRMGLSRVLFLMAEICAEKADHIETTWQDRPLSREWIKDAKALDKLAAVIRVT